MPAGSQNINLRTEYSSTHRKQGEKLAMGSWLRSFQSTLPVTHFLQDGHTS